MQEQQYQLNSAVAEQREVSGVLRNTYGLLALTLAFSGLVAYVSQQMRLPYPCLLYTSPSPRDVEEYRMPSSA